MHWEHNGPSFKTGEHQHGMSVSGQFLAADTIGVQAGAHFADPVAVSVSPPPFVLVLVPTWTWQSFATLRIMSANVAFDGRMQLAHWLTATAPALVKTAQMHFSAPDGLALGSGQVAMLSNQEHAPLRQLGGTCRRSRGWTESRFLVSNEVTRSASTLSVARTEGRTTPRNAIGKAI